jgi:hypothetical protein
MDTVVAPIASVLRQMGEEMLGSGGEEGRGSERI